MKLLFSVLVLVVLVIPIIPLKIYATSDSDRGYNDGLDQPFLNKQRASDSYNRGWHDAIDFTTTLQRRIQRRLY